MAIEIQHWLSQEVRNALLKQAKYLRKGGTDPNAPKSRDKAFWLKLSDSLIDIEIEVKLDYDKTNKDGTTIA